MISLGEIIEAPPIVSRSDLKEVLLTLATIFPTFFLFAYKETMIFSSSSPVRQIKASQLARPSSSNNS